MANTKISALTSATTPLAGTEVLPIVQSSATVKVATNDLTVRNIRANATTGILQVTGPTAATTRVMTVPDANFTVARTDAAQSFTGDQTLSTGNLVIGTSGKGIDFSATPGTGTSELLADYEEGTFTATIIGSTSAGTASYTSQTGYYTKIGNAVAISLYIDWSSGTGTGALRISGLPYASAASRYQSMTIGQLENVTKTVSTTVAAQINPSTVAINFIEIPSLGGANAGLAYDAAGNIFVSGVYFS